MSRQLIKIAQGYQKVILLEELLVPKSFDGKLSRLSKNFVFFYNPGGAFHVLHLL